MSTFLTPLLKENPFTQFNVASHKRSGIRLSFEYTTTLLSREGGEGRTGTATMFRKMLSKYTIFSTVLSKIVVIHVVQNRYAGEQGRTRTRKKRPTSFKWYNTFVFSWPSLFVTSTAVLHHDFDELQRAYLSVSKDWFPWICGKTRPDSKRGFW